MAATALGLISCATTDFVPYSGSQQDWEYASGSFGTEFNGVRFYVGLPDRPYEIVGYVDVPVLDGLNCPPESAESCWKRVVARNVRKRRCDAVIIVGERVTSETHSAQVLPSFFGPMVIVDTQRQKTRRAVLIRYKSPRRAQ